MNVCCVLANTINVFIYYFMEINVFSSYLLMFTSYKMCYPIHFVKNIWSNCSTIPINNRQNLRIAICNFFHDLSAQKIESSQRFPFENDIPLLFLLIILQHRIGNEMMPKSQMLFWFYRDLDLITYSIYFGRKILKSFF